MLNGHVDWAQNPPGRRRWMATSYGNDMALGNVSIWAAIRYCVRELLRGNGPCWISQYDAKPSRLGILRTKRRKSS